MSPRKKTCGTCGQRMVGRWRLGRLRRKCTPKRCRTEASGLDIGAEGAEFAAEGIMEALYHGALRGIATGARAVIRVLFD
ncbi:hypothetical protein GCM10009612_14380 [Streptomyces beijiangensis]